MADGCCFPPGMCLLQPVKCLTPSDLTLSPSAVAPQPLPSPTPALLPSVSADLAFQLRIFLCHGCSFCCQQMHVPRAEQQDL